MKGSQTYSQHTPDGGNATDNVEMITMRDVGTQHPEYEKRIDSWKLIEDCIDGEVTIKQSQEKYLPRPSGMTRDKAGNTAYLSYITRAHFPDFTSKFLSGLTGITKINPPKVKLPKALDYLIEDCDGDGTPLDVFFFQSVRLSLKTGRQLIFVDVDQEKNRLKLVRYAAAELINWGVVDKVYNEKKADYFVLKEQVNRSNSIFSHDYVDQYRVLSTANVLQLNDIGSESFISAVFDENGVLAESLAVPELRGKTFTGLPVVIIGSTDIDITPDQIPLLGVCKCALQMYMKDADLSNAMFLTCNPTLVMSGVSADENESTSGSVLIGSNIAITLEAAEARAYYTKTDASGLQEVRLSIKTYLEEAKHAGSALLSGDQKGVESGEALRIKAASTTASLSTTSQSVARGFEKAIKHMGAWMKLNTDEISVEVDTDYLDNMLTPEYIKQLIDLFDGNIISHKTALVKLIEGKFLDDDTDVELEMKAVEKEKEDAFKEFVKQQEVTNPEPADPASQGSTINNTQVVKKGSSEVKKEVKKEVKVGKPESAKD